ncbi:nucleotidyltransferase domain-containing protein [Candidatus Woesearchaeota archaeon]|nr:nucleotidyltransferase domain-containing protein [Candidatus Woesearchaeota archaeon]
MVIILALKEFLISNKNSRRIFGKKELEIIIKQLEGFALKQSERNRLSRDIKPKLEFIKEIAEFEDEFKLEKNQNNKRLIENAVETIVNDEIGNGIKAILLFGSFADNSFTPNSDIDICVIFKKDLSLKEATKFRKRVLGSLPEKLDVQVFNALPQKIKREIARNHKVLYKINEYDNTNFTIRYLKDDDYFLRMKNIFYTA